MSRKVFVGSLPATVTDDGLRAEFGKFGTVEDIFIKPNCEPSRQWAFVTFATSEQAQFAKESCDRILIYPGHDKPCDVMLAKNQGMFGQNADGSPNNGGRTVYPPQHAVAAAPPPESRAKKIFVGSLPDGIDEGSVRAEFNKYGVIEDIFLKQHCEPGRQWAFVTYSAHEEAAFAREQTNGVLQFPGSLRPCEVTLARNQGMFGQDSLHGGGKQPVVAQQPPAAAPYYPPQNSGPRKIFVGSLPETVNEMLLRAEFSKYGQILDVFFKTGQEAGRNWAFVQFATPEQASSAKQNCDRILTFPGSAQPCEVTIAKHQGMFGQDAVEAHQPTLAAASYAPAYAAPAPVVEGPKKIFVGSLPDTVTDHMLRSEFGRYGHVVDVFLKHTSEAGRHWAFVTFTTAQEAKTAKEATDRVLHLPGAEKACEVMLAKNQGKFGQNPMSGGPAAGAAAPPAAVPFDPAQPPPPAAPTPLTPWRMYKTAGGLPYYHNHATGATQWECPRELQVPGAAPGHAVPASGAHGRYSPY